MKQRVTRYLAVILAFAMIVTALPASAVYAADGDAQGGLSTAVLACAKFVRAGAESAKDGTDGAKAYLVGTGNYNDTGNEKAAARVEGQTAKGAVNLGGTRVAAMGFDLQSKNVSGNDPQEFQANLISRAELEITIFDGNDTLKEGKETKAAVFQVAADKFDGLANDLTANAPGATFPAKDGYAKDQTVYGDGWIKYHNYQAQDQKVKFDVTNWVKAAVAAGETHAIFRLQTVIGGYFVYVEGANAPKLSITTATEEGAVAQTLEELEIPRHMSADVTLPQTGVCGTQIAWTVREQDKAYLAVEGETLKVTRPTDADYQAELTATASLGNVSDKKTFPVTVVKTTEEIKPWALLDFNEAAVDGTFTAASAAGAEKVVAKVTGSGTAELRDRDAQNGKALYLDGSGKDKPCHLDVTLENGGSLLAGKEEITISFDAKPDRTATNWGFYAAPDDDKQNDRGGECYIGALINGGKTTIERYKSGRSQTVAASTGTDWSHVDVVFTEGATALYVNGEPKGSVASEHKLTDILGQDGVFYIGKANWGSGEYFKGWLDNFAVYDRALSIGQICTPETLGRLLAADKAALTVVAAADEDFALPVKGANGSGITWGSSDDNVIRIADGKAVITQTDAEQTAALTATLSLGGVSDTKEFTVKVARDLTDEEVMEKALEQLQVAIPNADDIRDNIYLPTVIRVPKTKKTAAVTWESSDATGVISVEKDGQKEPGMVNRPEPGAQDVDVTLTPTVTCGGQTRKLDPVTVTVKAKEEKGEMTSYLFAHFTGTEGSTMDEQIYFATSEDGSVWTDMTANGTPALISDIGDRGVRDPYLIRSPGGDKFYLIATDLSINRRGGWGNAQATTTGSTKLVIWESTDLLDWTEPRLVDVAGKIPGAGCAWAPEAFYDKDTGNYVVYWATASEQSNFKGDVMNMYYATTRDFYTFSEPVLWIDREHSIIDTTMIYDDTTQTYYRASGDGQITIEESKSIYDGWTIKTTLKDIFNNNNYSGAKLEGPEFFEYCQDDWLKDNEGNPIRTWGLMCDQYADGKGYLPFRTTDLGSDTTDAWSAATDVNFGGLKKRHGTIMALTDVEYEALMRKYGKIVEEDEEKILAEFDFNKEKSFADGKKGFESENAIATGTFKTENSYNEAAGKALYLDGTASNYLTVTDKDGGTLIKNANELTISYEFKPDRTSTNWVIYAAPNADKPVYKSERYVGVMEQNGTTTVERYNNGGQRPTNPTVQSGSQWHRIDIVMTMKDTTVYLNGKEKQRVSSGSKIPGILGQEGILQIGKANWENGEYAKGWIDNVRIKNRASSAEEIAELAAAFIDTLPMVSGAVVGTAPDHATALTYRGTDDHTAIRTEIDAEKKEITSYVRRQADLTNVPVTFDLNGKVEIKAGEAAVANGGGINLSSDAQVTLKRGDKTEIWTIKKPALCNNPVLPGQYADPDIDYLDGKYWIYPTTDGYPGWSGTKFHAFSSPDMENWTDEGIILELANEAPGTNENGVQIAVSPWAKGGSAWAPTIEEKDGKYYFYYCGKFENGESAVGVAVADDPAGPYTDKGTALVTVDMCKDAGASVGQAIDPSIFTDDNGKSYILLGNGSAVIAELNDDMMSIKEGTLKRINGLTDFRESVIVTKANGIYHWTWSCDDANSPNYHVNYGTSTTLVGSDGTANVTLKKKNLLSKDESKGILGSAHQSVLRIKDESGKLRYFMAYHRFYTPIGIFTSGDGLGTHRETCIDEITFNDKGEMVIQPTLEGVGAVIPAKDQTITVEFVSLNKSELTLYIGRKETLKATVVPVEAVDKELTWTSSNSEVASVDGGVVTAKAEGKATITAKTANGKKAECVVTVKKALVEVSSVSLNKTQLNLKAGQKETLLATVLPADATDKAITWTSSAPGVASVANGVVTAVAEGTATITAQAANGKKAECVVTVTKESGGSDNPEVPEISVQKIKLNKTKITLGVKEKFTLKATISPKNATDKKLHFESNKPKIATINQKGQIVAKKSGKAVITVTAGGKKAKCTVTVKAAPKKITLNAKSKTLKKGRTFQIKVKLPKNTASYKMTYKTSNKKVATVSSSGKVKAVKKGNATITVKSFNGKSAKLKIKVK